MTTVTMLTITASIAGKIKEWLTTRGGVARWRSVNFVNLGEEIFTPATTSDGIPADKAGKPHWSVEFDRIITDPAEFLVALDKEVKRFHVAIRRGSQGLCFKLTDGSSRKLRAALDKAGENSSYRFDYGTQEAVIFKPDKIMPLTEWNPAE